MPRLDVTLEFVVVPCDHPAQIACPLLIRKIFNTSVPTCLLSMRLSFLVGIDLATVAPRGMLAGIGFCHDYPWAEWFIIVSHAAPVLTRVHIDQKMAWGVDIT